MTVDSKATTGEREREICGATKKGNFGEEFVFGMGVTWLDIINIPFLLIDRFEIKSVFKHKMAEV